MQTLRHISGSRIVIAKSLDPRDDHYIDVRFHRADGPDILECVRFGHVYRRERIAHWREDAADKVMRIVREELLP